MFPYFGSKAKIAHRYPAPTRGLVIEPFCGSARYALLHRNRDVWLNDLDPLIFQVWRYVQTASRRDIESLPDLRPGDDLRRIRSLSATERAVFGMFLGFRLTAPTATYREWAARRKTCQMVRRRLLEVREHARDWRITNWHYARLPYPDATWFVDAPYQRIRTPYRYSCVADYDRLAGWCRSRRGQVVVCEGMGADWLPFRPLARHHIGSGEYFQEMVWTRSRK